MRKLLLIITCFYYSTQFSLGQDIMPAPENKSVVYFVRTTSLGFLIDFDYLDSTSLIGRFNGPKYLRYECNPGKHLFWARSENRDFIEADLLAGKVYFIAANVLMGAMQAAVELNVVHPKDEAKMAKILKLLKKKPSESFTAAELEIKTNRMKDAITRGIKRYNKEKENGIEIERLESSMFYSPSK